MKLCIRAVYTPVLTGEKLHFVSAKNDNFRLALTADIAQTIDRTPVTVRNAINALEKMGLVERRLTSHKTPDHIYVKLPSGEDGK